MMPAPQRPAAPLRGIDQRDKSGTLVQLFLPNRSLLNRGRFTHRERARTGKLWRLSQWMNGSEIIGQTVTGRVIYEEHGRWERAEDALARFVAIHGIFLIRISLALVFVWFGAVKLLDRSSMAWVVQVVVRWMPEEYAVPFVGTWEVVLGLLLLAPVFPRITVILFLLQQIGTFMLAVVAPNLIFGENCLALTPKGHFLVKNLVFLGGGLLVCAELLRSANMRVNPSEAKMRLEKLETWLIGLVDCYGDVLARISLAVVFLWLGLIKYCGWSPLALIPFTIPGIPLPYLILLTTAVLSTSRIHSWWNTSSRVVWDASNLSAISSSSKET